MAQNVKQCVWSEERKPESPQHIHLKTIISVTWCTEADRTIQYNSNHSTAKLNITQ